MIAITDLFDILADIAIIAGIILGLQFLYYRNSEEMRDFKEWKAQQQFKTKVEPKIVKSHPNVIELWKHRKAK